MGREWLVFGGWSFSPQILEPVFGPGALYVDSNELFTMLVNGTELRDDWIERSTRYVVNRYGCEYQWIAGWSTGAIFAYLTAHHCSSEHAVLISATPSFCKRQGFRFGMPPSMVASMREGLESDPEQTLVSFERNCGLENDSTARSSCTVRELSAGLLFLQQSSLFPVKPLPCPATFVHGENDRIVPYAAGQYFADQCGSAFFRRPGGHAFFMDDISTMKTLVSGPLRTRGTRLDT